MKKLFVVLLPAIFLLNSIFAVETIEDRAVLPILTPGMKDRKVLKLRLDNGLEAYLVSDPKLDESGAVLSIEIGSWDNPKESPGLAHFLEHMLFLGTKQYPNESEYQRYISENGGHTNAYTSETSTSYMFSVQNSALENALDRFSSFFKDPLFNPSGVSRELIAIDQEYAKNLENDERRLWMLTKELANPSHPYHQFSSGNSASLSKVTQEELKKWYQDHYSANLMHLVVFSNMPLDKLKDLVVEDFSQIPNKNISPLIPSIPLYSENLKRKMVYIEPVKNHNSITILWEVPGTFSHLEEIQPDKIICFILGHEGHESLLAQLKREGLAEKLECGFIPMRNNAQFALHMELTPNGVRQVDEVVLRVFQAIAEIKSKEIPKYIFDEMHQIGVLNWQYQGFRDVFEEMMLHSDRILHEKLETYPESTLILQKYDPEMVKNLLSFLTPNQALYLLVAPRNLTEIKANQKDSWMGTLYSIQPINQEWLEKWNAATSFSNISISPVNPFIPASTKVLDSKSSDRIVPKPDLIVGGPMFEVYFAQDDRYQVPQVRIAYELKTPEVDMGNPTKVVLADLFVKSIKDVLSRFSYPALLAGLEYEVSRGDFGIKFSVEGYSDKAILLFEEIVNQLKTCEITDAQISIYKDSLIKEYENLFKKSPLEQAAENLKYLIYKNYVSPRGKILAIKNISNDKYREYCRNLFSKIFVEGMIYGNILKEEAKKTADILLKAFPDAAVYTEDKRKNRQVIILPQEGGPFSWDNTIKVQGNAALLLIQQPYFDFKARAMQQILMQAINEPFFSTLRTIQQTGYIVMSDGQEIQKQLFDIFAVQSNTNSPLDLLIRFELFFEDFLRRLPEEITEERFDLLKDTILSKLKQPAKNLVAMGELLQKFAFEYEGDFDWIEHRIQGVKNLTYSEFLQMTRDVLGRSNKRRVAILMKGIIPKQNQFTYEPLKNIFNLKKASTFSK